MIYQPTLTQIKDDTPALLLNRPPSSIPDLFVYYGGDTYWRDSDGKYTKTESSSIGGYWA